MLSSLPVALAVGAVLGFLSGLGIGGGSLLVLWMTLVLNTEPQTARAINLLFFLPSALVACWYRHRQGKLKLRPLLPAILAGCITAALGSWLGAMLDTEILKKLFGVLLLAAGTKEVLFREDKL